MKTSNKIIISIAISGCLNAHADTELNKFLSDSTTSLSTRNFYIDLVANDLPPYNKYDMGVWAQSFSADFESGYAYDHFGLDISAYDVIKLNAEEGFGTRHVFKVNSNGNAEGFFKLPVYALKQKFRVDDVTYKFYEGRRILKDFGAISAENNAGQSSYYGLTSEVKSKNWDLKLGYLTEYSDSDTDINETMTTASGKDIDYIYTADVAYQWHGNEVRYYVGESQNYLRRHFLGYSTHLDHKKLSAKLFVNQALRNWKNLPDYNRSFDNTAYQVALESEFYSPKSLIKLGYAYTSAPRESSVGQLKFDLASNAKGNSNSPSAGVSKDFTNDGESVFSAMYLYQLTSTLKLGTVGRYGFNVHYKDNDMYQYEVGLLAIWTPETIQGLNLTIAGGPDGGFKHDFGNTPKLDSNGNWIKSHGRALAFTAQYTF